MANKLLIVDDDARIGRLVVRVAKKIGYETASLDDSTEFDAANTNFAPSVIVLDLNMPGMDGVELLRLLAKRKCEASVLLISGEDSRVLSTTERLGGELGLKMGRSLQKPIDVELLRDALGAHYRPDTSVTETDLAAAIKQDQLHACYQPKIDLATGKVCGAEALVRWRHPTLGQVFPDDFIPLAEASGLVVPLTYRMIALALKDSAAWSKLVPDMTVAVNLSAVLLTDLTVPDRVAELLAESGADSSRLILEVTESGAMADPAHTMDILARLRLKGIQLSIDDFGTGYSSLVQLYRLPYGELKVDKSFVMESQGDEEAAVIVRSIIALAHGMNLKVVAEGIENQATMDWLAELGCDIGQGYHIAKPLEAEPFLAWLTERES